MRNDIGASWSLMTDCFLSASTAMVPFFGVMNSGRWMLFSSSIPL